MPSFPDSLFSIGTLCDAGLHCTFTPHSVHACDPKTSDVKLQGWREAYSKLWRFPIDNNNININKDLYKNTCKFVANSAYDLPSISALIKYHHASAGFPIKNTWCQAIKNGNYATWPGLTEQLARRYCPDADETILGTMSQSRQNVRSTKLSITSTTQPTKDDVSNSTTKTHEAHVFIRHKSKMYSDQTGKFPYVARSGNQYIMVVYVVDPNVILATAFKNKTKLQLTEAYMKIKKELNKRGFVIDLHMLDNEAPEMYRDAIEAERCTYQLVSPNNHRRNAAERAIRTFKEHFLRIIAGIDESYPMSMWDHLLQQTIITLNLLRQSKIHPHLSAWEHYNGIFDYNATPLGPTGCKVLIHEPVAKRLSWGYHAQPGFYTGPAMNHYRNYTVFSSSTRVPRPCEKVEFRHSCITVPQVSAEDKVIDAMSKLKRELAAIPTPNNSTQLEAMSQIKTLFHQHKDRTATSSNNSNHQSHSPTNSITSIQHPTPRVASTSNLQSPSNSYECPFPKSTSKHSQRDSLPRESVPDATTLKDTPVATRTRSKTQKHSTPQLLPNTIASRTRSKFKACSSTELLTSNVLQQINSAFQLSSITTENTPQMIANAVLDADSGKMLEYRQLMHHKTPKFQKIWTTSAANEFGRLFQGVGVGSNNGERVEGTNAFFFIKHSQAPKHKLKDITYARVVCSIRPMKEDIYRTRITVGGDKINYVGDVGTPNAHLETAKLLLNSVLSRPNAKFMTLDLTNFYLMTPMDDYECMRFKLDDVPQEIIDECNLQKLAHNGWVCVEIRRGAYGLPQAGVLAYNKLSKILNDAGHQEAATTPGLWSHKWRPIMFTLVVDDFGVEYVGKEHVEHLMNTLKTHYELTADWNGTKFLGIDLQWDYDKRTVRLSMNNYIATVLQRFQHPVKNKPTHSPHPHSPPSYGAKIQLAPAPDDSSPLNDETKQRMQAITGALLCYARAVDNKLLVALGTIATQTHAPTQRTAQLVDHLLNYVATYPNDGIIYRKSDMQLAAHSDAGYLNENNAKSRASAHTYLSENVPMPPFNGAILSIAQIIKYVMSSAAEAELAALFITARKCAEIRHTLLEMKWPQQPTPIQVDNTTAVGVVTNNIIPKQTKSMDMRLWWLRCRTNQKQFRPYWATGKGNLADYNSKHHSGPHHISQRPLRAGLPSTYEPQQSLCARVC